jgi:hypothetical protein
MKSTLLFTLLAMTSTAQAFEFDVEPLLRGRRTALRVADGTPGHLIEIVRSSQPPVANATCPPVLGGACLDLVAPVRLASVEVSSLGLASFHPVVPESLTPQDVWFQAIDRTTGEKSPVVHSRVLNLCSGDLRTDVPSHMTLLANCGELTGTLTWYPVAGTLPELPWIQKIRGNLIIRPGQFVTEFSGPPRLWDAGGIVIEQAPNLDRITGFGDLQELDSLTLDNVGELSRNDLLTGQAELFRLKLRNLPWMTSLTQLGPLPPLVGLDVVRINLVDLTGMHPAPVESLDLSLVDMPMLESLQGVSPPHGDLTLLFEDTPLLSDLSGLEGAVSVGHIIAMDAPQITDFEPLSGLAALGYVQLLDMDGLTTVEHLSGGIGPDTSEVWLGNLPELTSVFGLDGLGAVQRLSLVDLPRVTSLTPLAGVTRVRDDFDLERLSSLTSLDGLQALRDVTHLEINENPLLTDVSALSGLTSAYSVDLHGNALLCEDDVLAALAGAVIAQGLDMQDNGTCPTP